MERDVKYLGALQLHSVKSTEMKDMITKEYYWRIRKILKASLDAGNTVQAIHALLILLYQLLNSELE